MTKVLVVVFASVKSRNLIVFEMGMYNNFSDKLKWVFTGTQKNDSCITISWDSELTKNRNKKGNDIVRGLKISQSLLEFVNIGKPKESFLLFLL